LPREQSLLLAARHVVPAAPALEKKPLLKQSQKGKKGLQT
jgi:hypothetical protein